MAAESSRQSLNDSHRCWRLRPYAKKATATIPIVFMYVPDPVGPISSKASDGRAATHRLDELFGRAECERLEYLKEVVQRFPRRIADSTQAPRFLICMSSSRMPPVPNLA